MLTILLLIPIITAAALFLGKGDRSWAKTSALLQLGITLLVWFGYDQSKAGFQFIAQTDALLTDHAPSRREYLRQREAILPEAKSTYPELFKTGSAEHKVLVDTLKAVPALKRLPGYEMVIGDAILGMNVRFERANKATGSKGDDAKKSALSATRKVIAPAIPKSSASRPPAASTKGKSNRFDRVVTSGSMDDLTAFFGG